MIRLMRALTGKRTRDEGFSLIEVVIAAVILGLVSVALLNGLSTLNLASKLQKTPSQEYANLATAQVLVQRTAFTACSTNANPYATALNTQLTALNVSIVSIKGIPANDTTKWYTCGSSWPVDGSGVQTAAPTVLQQITLQANIGRQSTRTVFKASSGAYPVGTDGTSVFSVTTTVSGTLGNVVNIPSGCSPSLCTGSATLGATAYPATATSGNMV
ncbi:MAG: type II secretion system protein J, partial [Micrococcales bacterium]